MSHLPPKEETEILCLTIRQHNCVNTVKGSVFSSSSFHWLSLLVKKRWCIEERAEADLCSMYYKGFFTSCVWEEMKLDGFQCTVCNSVPPVRGKVGANYQNPHSVTLFSSRSQKEQESNYLIAANRK